jgi:hypothetical protein
MPQAVSASKAVHDMSPGNAGQRAGGGTDTGAAASELGGIVVDMRVSEARRVPASGCIAGRLGAGVAHPRSCAGEVSGPWRSVERFAAHCLRQ